MVKDYDEATIYVNKLKFEFIEDTYQPEQDKRWVVVAPPNSHGVTLLLAKPLNQSNITSLVIKPAVESFCSSILMISGATLNV